MFEMRFPFCVDLMLAKNRRRRANNDAASHVYCSFFVNLTRNVFPQNGGNESTPSGISFRGRLFIIIILIIIIIIMLIR